MALQLKGDHKVSLSREQVWCMLNDPGVLQEVIPGCEQLVRTGEDHYELALGLLIGSVSGNYKGSVALADKKSLEYYDLTLVGEGSIGFVKGRAHFVLTEKDGNTIISYDGEAEVGGLVAGVGNRVIGGIAKFMVKRFFKAFDNYIKDHDVSVFTLANAAASAAALGAAPAAATETTVDVGGISLRAQVEGKEGAPWVVMSHSIMADSHIFDKQAAALRDDFRVLRIDIRGHGGSQASPAPYDMALLVEDVVKALDHFDIDKAHFIGLSLGGMIGFGLALAHPQRVASLVIASARADAPEGFVSAWDDRIAAVRQDGMKALAASTVERWFPLNEFLTANPAVRTSITAAIENTAPQGFEGCARALQGLNYLPDLGSIQARTLLIAGANDATIPDDMRVIQSRIAGSRFEVIANAGHIPTMDNADTFNRIVVSFLKEVAGIR
jgi:3-oxoadipate enol-lactonase